jgi:hypothetical protein
MFSPTSPITGAAQTGFTAPTYTFVDDVAPNANGKQKAITAVGGTQVGVTAHSVSSPFTITFAKPKAFKALGQPNPVTGRVNNVPKNTYNLMTRKGVIPLVNQPYQIAMIKTAIDIPAGSDVADIPNLRAMISAHIGILYQISAGLGDTVVSGVM